MCLFPYVLCCIGVLDTCSLRVLFGCMMETCIPSTDRLKGLVETIVGLQGSSSIAKLLSVFCFVPVVSVNHSDFSICYFATTFAAFRNVSKFIYFVLFLKSPKTASLLVPVYVFKAVLLTTVSDKWYRFVLTFMFLFLSKRSNFDVWLAFWCRWNVL